MYKVTKQLKIIALTAWSITIITSCGVRKNTPSGPRSHCVSEHDTVIDRIVYTKSDILPVYGTNSSDFLLFFSKEFNYPQQQLDFQGKVILEFIIDDIGNIYKSWIYNKEEKDHSLVDKEALRVLKLSSRWKPAKCNERYVWFRMKIPITF